MEQPHRFADRDDAGRRLGETCRALAAPDPVVLGLTRGGVPVAAGVAAALGAPLDAIVVRKVGAPMNPEFGIGAIAEGGEPVLDAAAERIAGTDGLATAIAGARDELTRATAALRDGRAPLELAGHSAIVVDDGIATGGTARAALRAARARGATRAILAVPVAEPDALDRLAADADAIVCLSRPRDLGAVGLWYDDFAPVPDARVRQLLARPTGDAQESVRIPTADGQTLDGDLALPPAPRALVVFAHGSGSSRLSPRNRMVAERLRAAGLGTLLLDLLAPDEAADRARVFDIPLLSRRLGDAVDWAGTEARTRALPIACFGASTGAAAALRIAAERPDRVQAVVARGGRPDLAGDALPRVRQPVLLLVGGADRVVLSLNREAREQLGGPCDLVVVPGATHLFEEPGALERVAQEAAAWLTERLAGAPPT